MTTIDINDLAAPSTRAFRPFAWLGSARAAWRRAARRRRTIQHLSTLDAHLLRDIGIAWEDVSDGLQGHRRTIWLNPLPRDHE